MAPRAKRGNCGGGARSGGEKLKTAETGFSPRWLSLVGHEAVFGSTVGSDTPLTGAGSCSSGSGEWRVVAWGGEGGEAVTREVSLSPQ